MRLGRSTKNKSNKNSLSRVRDGNLMNDPIPNLNVVNEGRSRNNS